MNGSPGGRRNWTLSMTIVLLVAALAAAIGFMTSDTSTATDRYYFKSTAGNVLFDHGAHGDRAESCAACHHTLYEAAVTGDCGQCHDPVDPADFKHAELKDIHGRDCATCHKQVKDDDQAASCRSCHVAVQKSDTRTVSCATCHDDGYEPDMMSHDEYLEIEDHSCLGCHNPSPVSEAFHTSCTDCHLKEATDRFAHADGSVNCSGCHLR